jgi:predicted thioesterase
VQPNFREFVAARDFFYDIDDNHTYKNQARRIELDVLATGYVVINNQTKI